MENKKLYFDIDVSQIDIRPILKKEFLELTMKAISTANPNRNNSWFTRESLVASIDTFKNKPILGYFENGDFVSHNGEWREDPETQQDYWDTSGVKGERAIGFIRESDEVQVVDDPKTGLSWAVLTCALWTQYNYKQVKRLLKDAKRAKQNGVATKNVSVEVDITDYERLDNGVMKINAFNLVGITILGSRNGVKVEPGIEGAELSVVDIMGTDLYEKQMQSLRLAYEKLDNSDQNQKEDFSEMAEGVENLAATEGAAEGAAIAEEQIHTNDTHAEQFSADGQAAAVENTAEGVAKETVVHENHEQNEGKPAEDVCPKCGKTPCECAVHEHEACPCEEPGEKRDPIRDIAWLISDVSWNISSFQGSIEYYEKHEEIPGREYILSVLRRFKAQAEENEKELAGLMAKVAEGISEEEMAFAEQLCGHCDCKTEYAAFKELSAKCEQLEKECEAFKAEKESFEKAKAHEEFMVSAKEVISSAKLSEEISVSFEKECEAGTISSIEDLKTRIGLKLYELKSLEVSSGSEAEENASFSAPVEKPNTNSFVEERTNTKKDKWDLLREYNKK